jgi:hypothetical protein
MKKSFEGAPAGVGAVYAWSGNDDAGTDFEKGLAALKGVSEKGTPSGEAAAK